LCLPFVPSAVAERGAAEPDDSAHAAHAARLRGRCGLGVLALVCAASVQAAAVLPIAGAPGQSFQVPWHRIEPQQLLVLVNLRDPQSMEVADAYMARYAIPAANRLELSFNNPAVLLADDFAPLHQRVHDFLQTRPQLQAIAVTWTEPWRVSPAGTADGMSITSALTFGFLPEYYDSGGEGCVLTQESPLYGRELAAPYSDFGLRPAMMLGGAGTDEVLAYVDRSRLGKSTFPLLRGYLVRTSDAARSVRYWQMEDADAFWNHALGLDVDYIDNAEGPPSNDCIRDASDVLYYFTGLTEVDYLDTLRFVPGAVADHVTSAGGELTGGGPQMSILRWLEAGASGSYGTVTEPCSMSGKFPNVDMLLRRYFAGATLIDAYWQSVQMPGEGVFVGDPLAQPYASLARLNGAGQVELATTGLPDGHLYKVVGVNGSSAVVLLNGIRVAAPELRVLTLPPGFATYRLLDTGNTYSDHGAPVFAADAVTQLDLPGGVARFDLRARDPQAHEVYYTFQPASGALPEPSADYSVELRLEGDVDGDGHVNFTDLGVLKQAMWSQMGQAGYVSDADLSGDGLVNFVDLGMLQANFWQTHLFVRISASRQTTADLVLMAFDKWGSESRVTARVAGGALVLLD
jgi:uncharacterized protein (TIGR03790 family)